MPEMGTVSKRDLMKAVGGKPFSMCGGGGGGSRSYGY